MELLRDERISGFMLKIRELNRAYWWQLVITDRAPVKNL